MRWPLGNWSRDFRDSSLFGGVWERGRSLYGMKEILIGGAHQCDLSCGGEGLRRI